MIIAYLAVEFAGAAISGSLALVADAAHTESDIAALGLALAAAWVVGKPHTVWRSFGYLRAEVLSALANGTALLVVAVFIFVEAGQRIADPPRSSRRHRVGRRIGRSSGEPCRWLGTAALVTPEPQRARRSWPVAAREVRDPSRHDLDGTL